MRFSSESDQNLLKAAALGRFDSFQELLERHGQRLHNFIFFMTSSQAARQEIFTSVWVDMWKLRGSQVASAEFSTALFVLGARQATRHTWAELAHPPSPPDRDAASLTERGQKLCQALGRLSLKERAALLLVFFDSLSYNQAAQCLSEREENIRELVAVAYTHLRALLGSSFFSEPTTSAPDASGHLDVSQLLEMGHRHSMGPLFEQAREHLEQCASCRSLQLQREALQALAWENAPALEPFLCRATLKEVRRAWVEEQLAQGAGADAARSILLHSSSGAAKRRHTPAVLWVIPALLLAMLWGVWQWRRQQPQPSAGPSSQLPFEFQEPPVPEAAEGLPPQEQPAAAQIPSTVPRLSEEETLRERQLETQARKLLQQHLQKKKADEPAPPIALEPKPAPRAEMAPQPAPELPLPSLRVDSPRFRVGDGQSVFHIYFPEPSPLEIRVFDLSGRSVCLVTEGTSGPGECSYAFAGKADSGTFLSPGSYYARIMTRWFARVETLELLP